MFIRIKKNLEDEIPASTNSRSKLQPIGIMLLLMDGWCNLTFGANNYFYS